MKIKNLKLKIIFLGSSKFVIPIIEVLLKNFSLSLVLTTENPKDNLALQGDALQSYPVVKYCIENKISYRSVANLSDSNLKSYILNLKSPIAVLADFGLIIPKEILNAFPKGIINIHPSLLPKYRGPTPVQTAILNGEKITGVTIIKLDDKVDHGTILFQKEVEIMPKDTSESLYQRLFALSASSIVQTIELYVGGEIKPKEQDHKHATFTKPLTRQNGFIDFNNPPSLEKLQRMIPAYFPWPGVWTKLKIESGKLKIIKLLPFGKIQVEGKKPVGYKDFINGYPQTKQKLEKLLGQLV